MHAHNSKVKIRKILKPNTYNLYLTFGFTLVELLVVVTLVAIIGLITTQIFIIGFTARSKTEILKEVKQTGDYSLSVIESMTRNAVDIAGALCNTNSDSLTIVNPDGLSTTFDCSGTQIASISGLPDPTPTVSLSLTSSNVKVTSCNFRIVCPTPPLSPKYVFVNFTVSQTGSSLPPERRASVDYQTTISLRTYQ